LKPAQQAAEGGTPAPTTTTGTAEKKEKEPREKFHQGRIIIRNITFDMREKHMRKEFQKYGEVQSVSVPMKNDKVNRGFAFVEYPDKEVA